MNGKFLKYTCLFLLFGVTLFGQDPHFSQFYSNPLYLAPSFAGGAEASRVTMNYRSQWYYMPNVGFNTYSFSYDHYFQYFNSGVGIQAMKDVAGTSELGKLTVKGFYSYNFKIFHFWRVRPGLSFGLIKYNINTEALRSINDIMGDDTYRHDLELLNGSTDIDFGSSILIYSKVVWVGASFDHLIQPNISLSAEELLLERRTTVFAGVDIIKKGKLLNPVDESMTFAVLLRDQGKNTQLDVGTYWHKAPLVLGLWYRGIPLVNSDRGDAIVVLLGYKTRYFNVGYSYDLTISSLLAHVYGTHELSVNIKFLLPRKKKMGAVPCPEF